MKLFLNKNIVFEQNFYASILNEIFFNAYLKKKVNPHILKILTNLKEYFKLQMKKIINYT